MNEQTGSPSWHPCELLASTLSASYTGECTMLQVHMDEHFTAGIKMWEPIGLLLPDLFPDKSGWGHSQSMHRLYSIL